MRALVRRKDIEEAPRLEARQDHHRAAALEHRLHRAGHGVLVIERHRRQGAIIRRCRPILLERPDPPELAGMGEHDALRPAGRARGIGLERRMVVGELGRIEAGRRRLQRLFVIGPSRRHRIEGELHLQARLVDDADDVRVRRRLNHRADAACVLDGEGQSVGAELGVQRHGHDAGAHGAVHHLDELEAVADRHGDAVAGLEAELGEQCGEAVMALVQLAIGHLARACRREVDQRRLVGEAAGCRLEVVSQVVVEPVGHG